jgi:hypothetical protein
MTDASGISGDTRTRKEMKTAAKTLALPERGLGVNDLMCKHPFWAKKSYRALSD